MDTNRFVVGADEPLEGTVCGSPGAENDGRIGLLRTPFRCAIRPIIGHQFRPVERVKVRHCAGFKDGKQRFGLIRSTVTTTERLQRLLVGLLLVCCLLILVAMRVSPPFRRQVCSRGKLGIFNLGHESYLATPDPPNNLFDIHHRQTGYA